MTGKQIKEKFQQGQAVFGSWIQECPWSGLVQIYAMSGMDCIFIGTEHSSLNSETVAQMVMFGRRIGIATIIRVEDSLYHLMAKPMDWGASGIMVPRIETADQVKEIIQAAKYAPIGLRGMSTATGHRDYCSAEPLGDYRMRANEENLVMVQIETARGLENVEKIASFAEIDVLFIGPMDLSCSLGIPGEMDHPRMQKAVEHIIQTAKKQKKTIGILVSSMEAVRQWYSKGVSLLTWSNELRMISGAATKAVEEFRSFGKPKG